MTLMSVTCSSNKICLAY